MDKCQEEVSMSEIEAAPSRKAVEKYSFEDDGFRSVASKNDIPSHLRLLPLTCLSYQ